MSVPKLIEGSWLYLVEDGGWNLKLGFSADLYNRLYDYRNYRCTRHFKVGMADAKCWILGVRPGTRQEEEEFHKAHSHFNILNSEWYPLKSRPGALLLLQDWQEVGSLVLTDGSMARDRVIWWGEGPHYSLVHRKTTSDFASLVSLSRLAKKGAALVLHPCPHCGVKFGARALRRHTLTCKKRLGTARVRCTHPTLSRAEKAPFTFCPDCNREVRWSGTRWWLRYAPKRPTANATRSAGSTSTSKRVPPIQG